MIRDICTLKCYIVLNIRFKYLIIFQQKDFRFFNFCIILLQRVITFREKYLMNVIWKGERNVKAKDVCI